MRIHQALKSAKNFSEQLDNFLRYFNRIKKKTDMGKNTLFALKMFFERFKISESQIFSPYFLGKIETNYRQHLTRQENTVDTLNYLQELKEYEQSIMLRHEPAVRMEMLIEMALEQHEYSPLSMGVVENFERVLLQHIDILIDCIRAIEKCKKEKREVLKILKEKFNARIRENEELELEIRRLRKHLKDVSHLLYKSLENEDFPIKKATSDCFKLEERINRLLGEQEQLKRENSLLLEEMRTVQERLDSNLNKQFALESTATDLRKKINLFKEKQVKKLDVQLYDACKEELEKYAKALDYLTDNYQTHLEYIRSLQELAKKKYLAQRVEEKCRASFAEVAQPYIATITPTISNASSQVVPLAIPPHKNPSKKKRLVTILSFEEYAEKYKITKQEPYPKKLQPVIIKSVQNTWWETFKMVLLEFFRQLLWISFAPTPITQVGLFSPKPEFQPVTRSYLDTLEASALI